MLLQSSSSPQDPHPGKAYGIVHILLALNIHIVAASGDQLTKAASAGKKQSWSSATSWRSHREVHAWFSSPSWAFCQAAHLPVPLPAQVWDQDLVSSYYPAGDDALQTPSAPLQRQTALLGVIKAPCRWESKNKMCFLTETAPLIPGGAVIGKQVAKCCWETGNHLSFAALMQRRGTDDSGIQGGG